MKRLTLQKTLEYIQEKESSKIIMAQLGYGEDSDDEFEIMVFDSMTNVYEYLQTYLSGKVWRCVVDRENNNELWTKDVPIVDLTTMNEITIIMYKYSGYRLVFSDPDITYPVLNEYFRNEEAIDLL